MYVDVRARSVREQDATAAALSKEIAMVSEAATAWRHLLGVYERVRAQADSGRAKREEAAVQKEDYSIPKPYYLCSMCKSRRSVAPRESKICEKCTKRNRKRIVQKRVCSLPSTSGFSQSA